MGAVCFRQRCKRHRRYKNKCGFITGNVLDGSVLIVNTDLIGDIKIEGYEDLLNPALKARSPLPTPPTPLPLSHT